MTVKPIPEGHHAVTPFIIVKGATRLLDFMKEAFGAEETARVVGEDGAIGHAETKVGDSVVMMFDANELARHTELPPFVCQRLQRDAPARVEGRS